MINLKQNVLMSFTLVAMFFLFLLIIFGDKGLADLNLLKKNRDHLVEKNERLIQESIFLYRSIERLKNDPRFIENVARQELGMITKDEMVFSSSANSWKWIPK